MSISWLFPVIIYTAGKRLSNDHYAISDMRQYRFSTPVRDYKLTNGRNVPTNGETIWHYPEGEFVYGKIYLKAIEYNVADFKS